MDLELMKIKKTSDKINKLVKKNIVPSDPIIMLEDKPIIFPKTINLIQGLEGTHKSSMGEILSSIFINQEKDFSLVGFHKNEEKKYALIYIDTERNIEVQFPRAMQRVLLSAGYSIESEIENFAYFSLIETNRQNRMSTIYSYIEEKREKYSNDFHLIIVIDVLTDCITDFNKVKESLEFSDYLNEIINKYDITVIGIIHENPSQNGQKARGHLGTELGNKSSTILSLNFEKKDSTILKLTFKKCRYSPKHNPLLFKYSEDLEQLEKYEEDDFDLENQFKAPKHSVCQYIYDELILKRSIKRKDLLVKICSKFNCSSRTAISRIDEIFNKSYMSNKFNCQLIREADPTSKKNEFIFRLSEIIQPVPCEEPACTT